MDTKTWNSGSSASRFVSETQLTEAQKKREEDLRAAYARMGQEPPPDAFQKQDNYDPRSLYEKLKANSDAKQEAWDEQHKLANQFRGIDEAESQFLAEIAQEKRTAAQQKEEETRKELEEFRRYVHPIEYGLLITLYRATNARETVVSEHSKATPPKSAEVYQPNTTSAALAVSKAKGKRKREGLLGVVRKKPVPDFSRSKDKDTVSLLPHQEVTTSVDEGHQAKKGKE